jgi:peptidyl-prolyl cis-trans isomerase A (cyclophilin A)
MIMTTRKSVLLAAVIACLFLQSHSFTFASLPAGGAIQRSITTTPSTALNAHGSRRREVFQSLRRGLVGVVALATFTRKPQLAVAEENSPTTGRIVELTVSNLDGVASQTGTIKIQLRPEWAPRGAQRFEDLTQNKFFEDCRLFRVLPGFVAQFGINGNPEVQSIWRSKSIPDDPVKVSNTRGTVVFATAGPNTRTTQIFFNTREQGNGFLDNQGFSPFGQVIEGMDIVDQFYSGYGEGAPAGQGPNQGLLQAQGNEYLEKAFPQLSYISQATFADSK